MPLATGQAARPSNDTITCSAVPSLTRSVAGTGSSIAPYTLAITLTLANGSGSIPSRRALTNANLGLIVIYFHSCDQGLP